MSSRCRRASLLWPAAVAWVCAAHASTLRTETLLVPLHSTATPDSTATPVAGFDRALRVAVVQNEAPGRRRLLVLLHGRSADPAERGRLALPIFPANARYFADRGFIVMIPLRVGYGATGGPDVEDTGPCADKDFEAGLTPAVEEIRRLVAFAHGLPMVARRGGLLVGDSFGGLVALAAISRGVPGISAAVNVAGGDGGDSRLQPDSPCQPDRLRETLAHYGATSHLPTLWMYSLNDRLWGAQHPKEWFRAYMAAGGRGQFVTLPADKNNGHFIFNRNAAAWHPAFERFVATLKFNRAAASSIRVSRGSRQRCAASGRGPR